MGLLGMIPCPRKHGDKYEEHPSCAIYESIQRGMVRLHCFGCGYNTTVSGTEGQRMLDTGLRTNPNRKPKPYQVELNGYSEKAMSFFTSRRINPDTAFDYGVRMVVGEDALHLPCRSTSGTVIGSQVRYLTRRRVKVKSYPPDGTTEYPHGSVVQEEGRFYRAVNTPVDTILIVESIADGLSIISREGQENTVCYALLGTKLSNGAMLDIHTLSSIYRGASIRVLFDPDEAGVYGGLSVINKLLMYYGVQVTRIPVVVKPYELEDTELGLITNPEEV